MEFKPNGEVDKAYTLRAYNMHVVHMYYAVLDRGIDHLQEHDEGGRDEDNTP